jgi:serine/threonine protein phosphatase PrpC
MQGTEDVGMCQEAVLGAAEPAVLFGVFDGHCGRGAAEEAKAALPLQLAQRLKQVTARLAAGAGADTVWEEAFLATDDSLRSEEGCTATAVLVWRDAQGAVCLQVCSLRHQLACTGFFLLYYLGWGMLEWCLHVQAANVGDSAAYFAVVPKRRSTPPEVMQLTGDHRYTNPLERERLAGNSPALIEVWLSRLPKQPKSDSHTSALYPDQANLQPAHAGNMERWA